ncbi:MAG: tail fiber domain-containing protein, partial [Patescibacteria group bacterium]
KGNTGGSASYGAAYIIAESNIDYRARGLFLPTTDAAANASWFAGVPYTGGGFQIGNSSVHTTDNASGPYLKSNAKLFINTSGWVGIGTSSPNGILHVVTTGGTTPLRVTNSDYNGTTVGSGFSFTLGAASGDTYSRLQAFDAGGASSASLVLNSAGGNVGIGTTDPTSTLTVVGEIKTTSGGMRFPDGTLQTTASGGASQWTTSGSNIYYNTGNVGIGTVSPGALLDVALGTKKITIQPNNYGNNTIGSNGLPLRLTVDNDSVRSMYLVKASDLSLAVGLGDGTPDARLEIYGGGGTFPKLMISSAENTDGDLMIVTSSGTVGIGTTMPAVKLQVVGDIRVGNSGTNGCVQGFGGTALVGTCTSDARLKTGISPLVGALNKVIQLQPGYFYWKSSEYPELRLGNERNLGFIAQDVEKVIPELVSTDVNGYKAVKYGAELQMWTIEALKELKAENDALKARVKTLEDKLL